MIFFGSPRACWLTSRRPISVSCLPIGARFMPIGHHASIEWKVYTRYSIAYGLLKETGPGYWYKNEYMTKGRTFKRFGRASILRSRERPQYSLAIPVLQRLPPVYIHSSLCNPLGLSPLLLIPVLNNPFIWRINWPIGVRVVYKIRFIQNFVDSVEPE